MAVFRKSARTMMKAASLGLRCCPERVLAGAAPSGSAVAKGGGVKTRPPTKSAHKSERRRRWRLRGEAKEVRASIVVDPGWSFSVGRCPFSDEDAFFLELGVVNNKRDVGSHPRER